MPALSAPLSAVLLLLHPLTAKWFYSGERWECLSQEHPDPFIEMWSWCFFLSHPSLWSGPPLHACKIPSTLLSTWLLRPKLIICTVFYLLDTDSSFSFLTLKLPGLHSPLKGWGLWLWSLQYYPVPAVSGPLPHVMPCLLSSSVLHFICSQRQLIFPRTTACVAVY